MSGETAYDYERQCWVTGEAGVRVHREHLRDELALLQGPRGAEYLRFTGSPWTLEQAIANIKRQLGGAA